MTSTSEDRPGRINTDALDAYADRVRREGPSGAPRYRGGGFSGASLIAGGIASGAVASFLWALALITGAEDYFHDTVAPQPVLAFLAVVVALAGFITFLVGLYRWLYVVEMR